MARLTALSRSVAGKRVIVTGAASGMGRATAQLFADEGARVAVVDLSESRVRAVVEEITAAYGADAARGFVNDVASLEALKVMVGGVVEAFGGVELDGCCYRLRLLGRRYLKNALSPLRSTPEKGIFFQIVLKGLAGFGGNLDKVLENGIPGYRGEDDGFH